MIITPALYSEADTLTEIAFAAKRHWNYPESWLAQWRAVLTITPEFVTGNETFTAREGTRILGFAALVAQGENLRMEHLWVLPAEMEHGVGRTLFRHAQQRAQALGFETFEAESDPHAAGFYEHMGAERIGTRSTLVEGTPRELPVFRVRTSHLPRNSPALPMIRAPYDSIVDQFKALRTTLHPKEFQYLSLLLDGLPLGSSILDLGCGTGQPIATHIASQGHRVVGVDGSEGMLALARAYLPQHRWIHALIEEVVFEETFAAVVCWDSAFHLPRHYHEPLIRRIHQWLAPGGRMMISSGALVDENNSGFTHPMFGHEFYYDSLTPGAMVAAIEKAGFDILVAETCNPPEGDYNKGKWATIAAKSR